MKPDIDESYGEIIFSFPVEEQGWNFIGTIHAQGTFFVTVSYKGSFFVNFRYEWHDSSMQAVYFDDDENNLSVRPTFEKYPWLVGVASIMFEKEETNLCEVQYELEFHRYDGNGVSAIPENALKFDICDQFQPSAHP